MFKEVYLRHCNCDEKDPKTVVVESKIGRTKEVIICGKCFMKIFKV